MSLNRRAGYGWTLGVDTTGSTTYVTLGDIRNFWDGPGAKSDVADVTILSDVWKQKIKTQTDGGELGFEIQYDPDSPSTTLCVGMLASTSATAPAWHITMPTGTAGAGTLSTENFRGYVTGFKRKGKINEAVVAEVMITVTGDPGFAGI